MPRFEQSNIPRLNHEMIRADANVQRLKICYSCRKGFCKRKGRAKAAEVFNMPGRHVCQKCANELTSGKTSDRITIMTTPNN
jgi:hypothetical protein